MPAPDALDRVTAFSRELAGTLRPSSVLELLVRHLKATFAPDDLAVGLLHPETGGMEVLHLESVAGADPAPALTRVVERGSLAGDESTTPFSLGAPIAGRRGPAGAVVLGGAHLPPASVTLDAFAAVAGVALESTRLVEFLDESKRSWEATVDAVTFALCIVAGGRIVRANRAFADLLGRQIPAVIGRPWLELVPPGWAEGLSRALGSTAPGEVIELPAGERSFLLTAFPINQTSVARRPATVLLFEDQTERRRLQSQLIQSEKMSAIGQLIAGVAHDLNNPLASVVGFADFLAESEDVPSRLREPLRVIQEEAERAASIVRNLLSFARQQEHKRRPTALRPLLTSTLSLLRNQLMTDHVEVQLQLEPDLPEIDVDPNQIQQVFVNLIHNASQAIATTTRPGTIVIRARVQNDRVSIDVSDNGPGVPPPLMARIFEPFFTTKPEGHGTGLGLSISHGIVKEHGGRIILSSNPGGGATFTVELPKQAEPSAEIPVPVVPAPARPLRILVVDDEPHILHYMRATLEAWGNMVEVAGDGHAGLERALADRFDLIITDLRMPRLGGREFYEELQRQSPAIAGRLVFSTGDTIRGDTREFLARQGRPCLHKPFSLAELRALLGEVAQHAPPPTPPSR
jgi:two-component system NtrC family sensor kinase